MLSHLCTILLCNDVTRTTPPYTHTPTQLAYRLILMITELLKQSPPHLDGELQETFDGVFHIVVNSGVTKLKPQTKLAPLLGYEGERDLKKRQKYSSLLEDMRVVSGGSCSLAARLLS